MRVGAFSDVDYGQFVGDLRLAVTPVMDAYRTRDMILNQLADASAGSKTPDASRVLFIGFREPSSLNTEVPPKE